MPLLQTSFSAQSRLSTANSTNGAAAYANMQLKTQVTLKSPFEGANLGPAPSKPQVGMNEFDAKSTYEGWLFHM